MSPREKLKSLLLEAGLSEAEVLVYLELMKGPVQIKWDLVGRTGLGRNKVYRAFDRLSDLKMVGSKNGIIEPLSLKTLVSELNSTSREKGKLAVKIRNVVPYLRMANESVDEFELLYTRNQLLNTYSMMASINYDTSLDFGDFESFVPLLGGMDPVHQFRIQRAKHAKNNAICTTDGPNTRIMARAEELDKFKATLDVVNLNFRNKWVIFSDTNDYVMINDMSESDSPCSVLIKSGLVANLQREYFKHFSQMIEK